MHAPPPITSRTNARVKQLRAAFTGKASRPGELVGIEGLKTILEARNAGLHFDTVAVTQSGIDEQISERLRFLEERDFVVLSEDVMASVADTVTTPDILATVIIPEDGRQGPSSGIFLLLEAIQDPGNLGTLIRSAEAFGVERVFLSPGCANPWGPKVIRASAGSVFRQVFEKRALPLTVEDLQSRKVRIVAAVAQGESALVSLAADLAAPVGVLVGNEGSGLSAEILGMVDERVYIPCRTESLNAAVAGSLLLYDAFAHSFPSPAESKGREA